MGMNDLTLNATVVLRSEHNMQSNVRNKKTNTQGS